MRGMPQIQVVE